MAVVNKQNIIIKVMVFLLTFCLSFFVLIPAVLAAPEDDSDLLQIDEIEDGENVDVFEEGDYQKPENEDDDTIEVTENKSGETTVEVETSGTQQNHGAFTVDGNGTIQDIIADGTKEFYVITTENGGVFYLLIDRANDLNNVYFLSEVDETDIQDFVVSGANSSSESSGSSYTSTNEETDTTTVKTVTTDANGNVVEEEAAEDEIEAAEQASSTESSSSSSSSSSGSFTGLIIIIVIIVIVIFAVLIWRSRSKTKKGRKSGNSGSSSGNGGSEDDDDEDYDDFDDDDDEF